MSVADATATTPTAPEPTLSAFGQSTISSLDGDIQITTGDRAGSTPEAMKAAMAYATDDGDPDPDDQGTGDLPAGDGQDLPTGDPADPAADPAAAAAAAAAAKAKADADAAAAAAAAGDKKPKPKDAITDLQQRVAKTTKQREEQRQRAEAVEMENRRLKAAALAAGLQVDGIDLTPATPAAKPAVDPLAALGDPPKFEDFADQPDQYKAFTDATLAYANKRTDALLEKDRLERAEADAKRQKDADALAAQEADRAAKIAFVARRDAYVAADPARQAIVDEYHATLDAEATKWAETHDIEVEPYPGHFIHPIVQSFLVQDTDSTPLVLHFMQHPEELQAIHESPNRDVLLVNLGMAKARALANAGGGSASASTPPPPVSPAPALRTHAIRTPGAAAKAPTTPSAAAPRTSAATPPPVTGSGGGTRTGGAKPVAEMTADEHREHFNKLDRVSRSRSR